MIYVLDIRTVRTHICYIFCRRIYTYMDVDVTPQYVDINIYIIYITYYIFYTTARGKLIMLFSSTVFRYERQKKKIDRNYTRGIYRIVLAINRSSVVYQRGACVDAPLEILASVLDSEWSNEYFGFTIYVFVCVFFSYISLIFGQ